MKLDRQVMESLYNWQAKLRNKYPQQVVSFTVFPMADGFPSKTFPLAEAFGVRMSPVTTRYLLRDPHQFFRSDSHEK